MFDPAARTARSAPGALAGSREICGKIGSHRVGAWHSPVAQSVERLTVNQEVAGSSPARGANYFSQFGSTLFRRSRTNGVLVRIEVARVRSTSCGAPKLDAVQLVPMSNPRGLRQL